MVYKMFSFAHKMLDYNLSYVTTTVILNLCLLDGLGSQLTTKSDFVPTSVKMSISIP